MQGFGAQAHLFSEVTGPQQFVQTKKEVSNGPRKVTDPIFVNPPPPPEGLLNNANPNKIYVGKSPEEPSLTELISEDISPGNEHSIMGPILQG